MTYTKEEQKQHRAELVEALLSGKYKQTKGALRIGDKFCCLGVACDVSRLGKWKVNNYLNKRDYLPNEVMDYYGFKSVDGSYLSSTEFSVLSLINLNDNGISFEEIAAVIKKETRTMFK